MTPFAELEKPEMIFLGFFFGKLLIALQLFPGGWTEEMKKEAEEEEDRSGLTGTE